MSQPLFEELDKIAAVLTVGLIGVPTCGLTYKELPIEQRIIVMNLAIAANSSTLLDNIDTSLQTISDWFANSKVYYP